jgi:hypothetical protein
LCAAARALAAMQVVVGNSGLQHFDSDGGVELDFWLTDQGGQPVGNLRPDDVQVFEDGKQAKIKSTFAAWDKAARSTSCS